MSVQPGFETIRNGLNTRLARRVGTAGAVLYIPIAWFRGEAGCSRTSSFNEHSNEWRTWVIDWAPAEECAG
jgi:hypothetical protein